MASVQLCILCKQSLSRLSDAPLYLLFPGDRAGDRAWSLHKNYLKGTSLPASYHAYSASNKRRVSLLCIFLGLLTDKVPQGVGATDWLL